MWVKRFLIFLLLLLYYDTCSIISVNNNVNVNTNININVNTSIIGYININLLIVA